MKYAEPLTIHDVVTRVKAIELMSGDDEAAHGAEDKLWGDVLLSIQNGSTHPHELAREALKTKELKFSRWCA